MRAVVGQITGLSKLARLVDLTSAGAQRVFGVANKGRMAEGYDGDVTLVDLRHKRVLRHADMRFVIER